MFKQVLALSPHTDDVEIAAGGTIHKLLRQGSEVKVIAFSWCENEKLQQEFQDSMEVLGVELWELEDWPRRKFPLFRQEILDYLWKIDQKNKPDLVITPSRFDMHQDHQVICEESIRAFRNSSIFGFELPRNNIEFSNTGFVGLTEINVKAKMDALRCYQTQMGRFQFRSNFHLSYMESRGACVKQNYAEAFEVIRLVV
jgi:LmbE family N-acetylglucosaminyl deacetylase